MAKTQVELTEDELFQLLDLAMTHGAESEVCQKLADACRRTMRAGLGTDILRYTLRETVKG